MKNNEKMESRPAMCGEEHLIYLDELRESGETNMSVAHVCLLSDYPALTSQQALDILNYWMKTFGDPER